MKKSKTTLLQIPVYLEKQGDVKVSYSQYTMWANCPKQWKLTYMDGHKIDDPSIHLIFGTAMHETIQTWLDVMYSSTVKKANELDLHTMLRDVMAKEYKKTMAIYGQKFTTKEQMNEFYQDGVEIIDYLKKKRSVYFSTKKIKLVGIELPIYYPTNNENVMMKGFLDLVFEDTENGRIIIDDIKTSTSGWNKWAKADKTKTAQLILYKKFFSEQYGYDIDRIDVQYLILKRKLSENAYDRRVQVFKPAAGSRTLKEITTNFDTFVSAAFNTDGTYRQDGPFPAKAGDKNKNCRFCPFKDRYDLCPKSERHAV